MPAAIEAKALTKVYGANGPNQVRALDSVEFSVNRGEIFGLIGADGAGKTTAFKLMSGVMEPTSGELTVLGKKSRDSREQVGYLTQPFSLYLDLSVLENLRYTAGLREVTDEDFEQRRTRYLSLFEMQPFQDRLAGQLSGGMKQKLALTCALIPDPAVLLLDEPTTGVDPVSRRDFWDALTSLANQGITIVVATPYFDEAERCHRVALMEQGRIFAIDSPRGFRSKLGLTRLAVHSSDLARAETALADLRGSDDGVADIQRFGDRLDVMVRSADEGEQLVRRRLEQAGLEVGSFRRASPTLENAFVSTLRQMRGPESVSPFPHRSTNGAGANSGQTAIGAYQLNKRFGQFQAVKDFNIEIHYGEVYGLLGANGAGKTTAIKMICGLLAPSSGEVALLGRKTGLRSAEVRSQIGYMSQKFTLYDDLTIGENLEFYAGLYGLPQHVRKSRIEWGLEIAGLSGQQSMLTGLLPGGWKQRVAFGAAVMHEPKVIFLDEPTSGVDPLARRVMWRMINELVDHGAAVLVVTHYLEEAEQCNRIGFMVNGEIVAQGAPDEIKKSVPGRLLEVETPAAARALQELRSRYGASRVSLFGDRVHVVVDSDAAADQVKRELKEHDIDVRRAEFTEFSLEDVFISLIEERRQQIPQ
jgi:drug efflux transport system ATP-binding protein